MNKDLITKLNQSPTKVFIAATGGGSSFIGNYLSIAGGSKTILGFYVPYAQSLFDEFIGGKPDKYVSSVAARKLAVASYDKAKKLGGNLGMGVSCSLTTGEGEREGRENWVHIAVHGASFTSVYDTRIEHVFETRAGQEAFVARIMLDILAYESGLLPDFIKWEVESYERTSTISACTERVMNSDCPQLNPLNLAAMQVLKGADLAIFSGSFNPIHEGHKTIIDSAEEILGRQVLLEISVKNADKAGLDYFDIAARSKALKEYPLILTNTPLIMDKIRLLKKEYPSKNITVVMGKDTWDRFLNPKYDSNIPALVTELAWNNVYHDIQFLVFGRDGGAFDPAHPAERWRIKDSRAENLRSDVSSREIRAGQLAKTC